MVGPLLSALLLAILSAHCQAADSAAKPAVADGKLYTVSDGNKVDPLTLKGWRTWRAMACERCHGANQEGMVGPSLIDSLKVLSKDQFKTVVLQGRVDKGMPNFSGSPQVVREPRSPLRLPEGPVRRRDQARQGRGHGEMNHVPA